LYGDHPYARLVSLAQVRRLDPKLAPTWLPRLYNPRNGVLVIAGDVDVEVAGRLAAGWCADWTGQPGTGRLGAPPVGPPPPTAGGRGGETVLITHRPVAAQVEMTFACRLSPATSVREEVAQRALATLLGGHLFAQI